MPLDYEARKILMLAITFGLHECLVLPQGIKSATDIFQERMISLFEDMKKPPPVYLEDILVTSNTTFEDHVVILNEILMQLNNSGMYVNATKSKWCYRIGIFGIFVDGNGYLPLKKRIKSILAILPPKMSNR